MIKRLLSKSFIATLLAAAAVTMVSCEEKDENGGDTPEIAVSTTSVSFTNAEESQTFQITSNADWKIEIEYSVGDGWLTVTPLSGNGSTTVNLSVPTNDTGAVRSAVVKCIAMHPQYGKWDTKRVNVSQSADGNIVGPAGDVLYSDNFDGQVAEQKYGTSGSSWPFLDQFPEFANPQGPAAANVTYTGTNMSVRANSVSDGNYSLYKDSASGSNNIFFGGAGNLFVINGIELAADQSNLQLTFGRYRSLYGAEDNTFVTSEFHIYLSKNGTAWEEISYQTPVDAASSYGTWNLATADFTLTSVPEKLYIKFTSDLASSHRIDDVKLSTGNGGQSVTLPEGAVIGPVEEGTIAAAIATADGSEASVAEATVIGIYNKGFLMEDATGKILVYTNETATVAIGDQVKVEGTVASYAGFKQFAAVKDASGEYGPAATVTKLGSTTFTQPAAEKLDGAAFDAYLSAPAIKYIEYTGTLSISGNYYNVEVEGASKAKGSIAYPLDGAVAAALNGTVVTIRGYAIGVTGTVYVNTMLVELVTSSEPMLKVDPTSLSFSADGGSKDITATLLNSTDAITAESDNAQFTTSVAGNVITVTAAANTTTDNISGTITIKAGALSQSVTVLQTAPSTGGDTMGIFESMACFLPSADDSTSASYTAKINDIDGLKLGTGSKAGVFTSSAVGVSGDVTFSFYAVAWKGKKATIYVAVDGTTVGSVEVAANDGATGNPPFTMTLSDSDYYSININGLTDSSKITLSTSSSLSAASDSSSGRAVICGMQLR